MATLGLFEIQSSDPAREADFYSKVFGWKFTKDDNIPIEFYKIEIPGHNLTGHLMKRPCKTPPQECGTNAFTCSFEVKDFDAASELIKSLGGVEAMPKFAIPGKCWQGYFVDCDNNTFGVFQPDSEAK
eukprot:m.48289 g.48289  ORF g.48289 m.48289 type:complete len:128 (-) comp10561_c0_seq5:1331-1714(-)